jgi:hypothetical protein
MQLASPLQGTVTKFGNYRMLIFGKSEIRNESFS